MAEGGESAKRQVAHKTKVATLMNGRYVKEDGWLPNYVEHGDRKISRANIIGVVVSKDQDPGGMTLLMDDGTGRIPLRFFDFPESITVGDIVNVVGRPREFGSERYLVPEIVKKVTDQKWVELRKIELTAEKHIEKETKPTSTEIEVEDEDFTDQANPMNKVFDAIRTQDQGAGVGFDEIIVKTRLDDVEGPIKKLLEQGDIFEIKPGRYKVLE